MRRRGHSASSGGDDLDALVRTHGPSLLKHVRYVYPHVDAHEVVNQAFVVAWQHFDAIPAGDEAVWLRSVVRRVVSNHQRGQRRWHALTYRVAQLTPIPEVRAPDNPENLELQAALAAIDTLSRADRQILMIAAVDELSTEGLGDILDLHPDAAKKRLSRARTRLRLALSQAASDFDRGEPS